MADEGGDENLTVLRKVNSFHVETGENPDFFDGNSPANPRESLAMRGQSVVASKLFSPSRTRRSADRKAKAKSFVVHSSPVEKLTSAAQRLGSSKEGRKTLQVLQPTACGDGTLVGSNGVIRHEKSKKKKSASIKPSKLKANSADDGTTTSQTESSDSEVSKTSTSNKNSDDAAIDETVALMVLDPPPERYWELLAEERRVALKDALEENETLHGEMEELRERCRKLEEVAGQAEYFASLYKMVMEGEVETSESDSEL